MKKPKPKLVRKPAAKAKPAAKRVPPAVAPPVEQALAAPEPQAARPLPPALLMAEQGHRIARAGWVGKTITGNGAGGFVFADGSPYQPTDEDLAATDWSVK